MVLAALSVLGLLTYTPFKRRWWGGPAWNSWIVALLPGLGYLAGARAPLAALASGRIALAAASCFFSYAVFVILGYLKDARADRATGYQTVVVRFGSRPAILCSAACALAAAVASTALVAPVSPTLGVSLPALAGAGLWSWGLFTSLLGHLQGWRVERDEEAFPAVASSVRGFVALHLGEAALLRPEWTGASLVLLALFELFLRARPERSQI
jgi:4-hydroxybenzoate polyprenyltransferase